MHSLTALADPTRRRIVEMLARGQLRSGDIARRFAISAPAVSQHLNALKQAHLVRSRVEAQRRIYELDPAGWNELEQWLGNIRRFWQIRLDALELQLTAAAESGRNQNSNESKDKKASPRSATARRRRGR